MTVAWVVGIYSLSELALCLALQRKVTKDELLDFFCLRIL